MSRIKNPSYQITLNPNKAKERMLLAYLLGVGNQKGAAKDMLLTGFDALIKSGMVTSSIIESGYRIAVDSNKIDPTLVPSEIDIPSPKEPTTTQTEKEIKKEDDLFDLWLSAGL